MDGEGNNEEGDQRRNISGVRQSVQIRGSSGEEDANEVDGIRGIVVEDGE